MTKRGHNYPGLWINFEACEGAGKGTQQRLLVEKLKNRGMAVESGREPGSTWIGGQLRRFLQDPSLPELNPKTEMLLYMAAGIEFFEEMVKPSLKKGEIFISDRWRYSTMAYQGYGLGIDLNIINILTNFSCSASYPDITFLLDVDPIEGLSKISGYEFSGRERDKIELREIDYHNRVNRGFKEIAKQNPERIKIIPYINGKPNEMHEQIVEYVDGFLVEHDLESKLERVKL